MILVDTTVWSLALRRRPGVLNERERGLVADWRNLSLTGQVTLIGVVRQEVLSGIRRRAQFDRLRVALAAFAHTPTTLDDHDRAAECFNQCQSRGIAAGDVDMLICATAIGRGLPIFTADPDFERYATVLAIRLHAP